MVLVVGLVAYTKPIFLKVLGKLVGREMMPGDITVHVFGRKLYLPCASILLVRSVGMRGGVRVCMCSRAQVPDASGSASSGGAA